MTGFRIAGGVVFPASAGINRTCHSTQGALSRVPRASGDKPMRIAVANGITLCSPREWG
ncbi:hypothetical protein [Pectobacterium versatile]|uniref:hypothetical protein n=1 Tax=Pectobacterium versatile TaxID=2488639 RepID=UPI0015DDAFE6|nr:hypothetical protein [Pectobacterium versatile]MBA0173692.1 hypothetical protein [Pectobacterium versatile]UEQ07953.1 hypothetical protein LLE50_13870 [Pectobacterium versatile]